MEMASCAMGVILDPQFQEILLMRTPHPKIEVGAPGQNREHLAVLFTLLERRGQEAVQSLSRAAFISLVASEAFYDALSCWDQGLYSEARPAR